MEPQPVEDRGDETALKRRRFLRISVKLGLLAVAAAFTGVFVRGMLGPARRSGVVIELAGIPAGSARLEAWNDRPVWVVKRSQDQLRALTAPSDHVSDPGAGTGSPVDNPLRSLEERYGIYLAATDRQGILVQYLRERPPRLDAGVPWHGGFIDPGSGALFDAAGRRYRITPGGPLAVPPHRYLDPGRVRLGEW